MINLSLTSQKQVKADKLYDLLIVGAGPAGLSAAIYAARKGLSVGIIGERIGGQVNDTSSVENYIGFDFITGVDLSSAFEKHVSTLDIDVLEHVNVKKIEKQEHFALQGDDYMTYKSRTVLIATGASSRKLGVQGEEELYGRGVTYCAICDGPLFADQTVTIIGGGNTAVEAAIDLSKIAKKVILVHRSQFRADKILIDKLETIENLDIHLKTSIENIQGETQVEGVHVKGDTEGFISTDGVLVEIGYVPNTQFLDFDIMNDRGEIIIDEHHKTAIEGLYAAGDVTTEKYKQIIVAASEGAKAALSINEYMNTL